METDRKYTAKKENRGWYFVEYHPPNDFKFANLFLTITVEDADKNDVIVAMEKEAKIWLKLYPIPLYVSAFDNKEDLFDFKGIKNQNSLMGFFDHDGEICLHWKSLKDEEIPDIALDKKYLDSLYSNFAFTTYAKLDADRKKRRNQIENGFFIFLILFGVIPFFFEIFIYFNDLFSLLAFFYALYKSIRKILELSNMWPKSKKQKEKEREEVLKEHYYYYCKMNPDGFEKLKRASLEIMAKDRIAKEAESLKKNNI